MFKSQFKKLIFPKLKPKMGDFPVIMSHFVVILRNKSKHSKFSHFKGRLQIIRKYEKQSIYLDKANNRNLIIPRSRNKKISLGTKTQAGYGVSRWLCHLQIQIVHYSSLITYN